MAKNPQLEYHELADMFPLIADADLEKLATSIKDNGLLEAITMLDGKILDGRNRYKAATIAGVDLGPDDFIEFDPEENGDPAAFVIAKNIDRRHLTVGQRAALAVDLYNLMGKFVGNGKEAQQAAHAEGAASESEARRRKAAKAVNVSEDSVKQAHKVSKAAPEEFEKVKKGKQTLHKAAKKAEQTALGDELPTAMIRITEVCGKPFATAVHQNAIEALKTPRAVVDYAALDNDTMEKLMPVLRLGWKLSKAISFIDKSITPASTLNHVWEMFTFGGSKKIEYTFEGMKCQFTKMAEPKA